MKKLISIRYAINTVITLLTVVLVCHALLLTEVIRYDIVWAGMISTVAEMMKLEMVSISINAFAILALLFKARYIENRNSVKILNTIILLLVVLFSLNTIGNLFAESKFF